MISFKQTTEDYIAFDKYYKKTHFTFIQKHWRWLVLASFSVYVFIASGKILDALTDWANWVIIGFMALIIFLLTRFKEYLNQKTFRASINSNSQNIGFRQIDYDDEKVIVRTSTSSTDYHYLAFIKVEENKDYFFLFTGQQTAVIIPKAIPDHDALLKLVEIKYEVPAGLRVKVS